jgi:hypothetical protein
VFPLQGNDKQSLFPDPGEPFGGGVHARRRVAVGRHSWAFSECAYANRMLGVSPWRRSLPAGLSCAS